MTTPAPLSLAETVTYLAAGRFEVRVCPGDPRIFVTRRGGPWPVTATLRLSVAVHREALHLAFGVAEVLAEVTAAPRARPANPQGPTAGRRAGAEARRS